MDDDKPTPKRRRRVLRSSQPAVPAEPKQRARRKTLPPGVRPTPAWKVAGSPPIGPDPEEKEG